MTDGQTIVTWPQQQRHGRPPRLSSEDASAGQQDKWPGMLRGLLLNCM